MLKNFQASDFSGLHCGREIPAPHAGSGILMAALYWATVEGALGFCGGFFGPMIFAPEANQGPLLGIFITGPLGFIVGGMGGLIYALWRGSVATD
jgi:hypothetical protein